MANTTGLKFGGRTKGTPNRLTKEVRSILKEVLYVEISQLNKHFEELEPKVRVELLIKLMPYVCPKITSESHRLDEPINFEFDI